ncbi:hypothetical protein PTTG_28124 [Puccinia triticina 1-1 BBBD Race 1]|uniref:Uncharacterized protein n=2 Tax=Puccinia triticina TaxID=208348 RepID=A0A180GGB9_PUCT1|nr:uncharacterized protein PtA15_4A564 [Puccinia triticina]OAV91013.1 hypothetical protein PTTG_28124 [Puccinia triticina 1-1 BBBD Race 1]WAQ84113.1 hypothetical protein PtA15_4A564 [Puccinia triticina]WAR54943.1 hypothetical protein PtB15_4B561 [Puccinia triticina]
MDLTEQTPGDRETDQRAQWEEEIASVARVLQGLTDKHSLEPGHLTPAERDPSLTIEDMGAKVKIWKKLHSILLPSIQDQLTLLLNSLDLIDPTKNPTPVTNPTLEILSNLDKTLESTVSAVVSLTLESPLPDEKHDHGLQNLKVFRCSYLRKKIQRLLGHYIYAQLFPDRLTGFIRWCAIANSNGENLPVLEEESDLRKRIEETISRSNKLIARTITWCRTPDWAVIDQAWIEASETLDHLLLVTSRTSRTIQSTPESDPDESSVIVAGRELTVKVAKSAISLVKLARILVNKTSQEILKKVISTWGTTTLELNSEIIERLQQSPQFIDGLQRLSVLLRFLSCAPRELRFVHQHIHSSVQDLPKDIESTLAVLDSVLIPLLDPIEHDSPEPCLKSFLPDLKQSWDTASRHLMGVISSFEIEHIAI